MTAVSVEELKAAWRALQAGAFAVPAHPLQASQQPQCAPPVGPVWMPNPGERVVVVVGCAGWVGASTVALAIGTAAEASARVVECCPPWASGLSAAASAELGEADGWRRGRRDTLLVERRLTDDPSVVPAVTSVRLTVLDTDAAVLRPDAAGWLGRTVGSASGLVLVTRPTVPGMRRLEASLELVTDPASCLAVAVGPPIKRWPRQVRQGVGPLTAELLDAGRLLAFPEDRQLAVTGITPDPLPTPLLRAGADVLTLL